jgi:hypothetical protein
MHVSAITPTIATAKVKPAHELNPAQQAKAADPAAKGAAFGALVAEFARAKHAPAVTPPPLPTQAPASTDPV